MREKETLLKIYDAVKPYRPQLAAAMVFMLLVAGLSAGQAYMVKPLLDEIFFKQDRFMLNLVPALLVLLFLVKGISYYGYNYLLNKVGQSVIKDLRNRIYQHVQSLPLAFFHKTPTGELISRVISDVTLIQGAVSRVLISLLKDFFQIVGLVVVIFYMNWLLALISFVFLPLLIYPIVQFGRKHRRLSTMNQQTTALVSNILYETITGNRIVKAFCREDYENSRFSAMLDKLFVIIMKDVRVSIDGVAGRHRYRFGYVVRRHPGLKRHRHAGDLFLISYRPDHDLRTAQRIEQNKQYITTGYCRLGQSLYLARCEKRY
jgi:subfamily B ATP-binding cassette protein MsbA